MKLSGEKRIGDEDGFISAPTCSGETAVHFVFSGVGLGDWVTVVWREDAWFGEALGLDTWCPAATGGTCDKLGLNLD